MSIEPHCEFCGLVDKYRCQDAEQAEECPHAPAEGKAAVIRSGPLAGLKRRHYGAIVADPPWSFLTRSDKGKGRSPENHYDCMTLDDIKAMPVSEIAAKDCVLFLWIIDTHLEMALEVIKAWGFTYKTKGFNWVKTNKNPGAATDPSSFFTGMGFWTRANPEDCLLATVGQPKRNEGGRGVRRLIVAERREHSRKPEEMLARVEELVPGPYCELFSRASRPGWDQIGNETGKFDPADLSEPDEIDDLEDYIFDKEVEDLI
tara:strand:+ start:16261 stop:17040 length:780 start_codon:yes stop_codon:yes gene_type:complete